MAVKVDEHHQLAIQEFLKHTVVPLIYELDDGRVDQLGTATLFKDGTDTFLITARHTFDSLDTASFSIPEKPDAAEFVPLSFDFITSIDPQDADVDLAVLRINSPETVSRLADGWRFLSKSNISNPSSPTGTYIVSGFPSAKGKIKGSQIWGSLNTIYTELTSEIPASADQPVHPELDLFFYYDTVATDRHGNTITTPPLHGVSGSAVWEYSEVTEGLWTAERAIKVIGVQTSYKRAEYVRGKRWLFVSEIIAQATA